MNLLNKALFLGLIALAFASCEKEDFLVPTTWTPAEVGELPPYELASTIVLTNETVDSVPLAIIEALYPGESSQVQTYQTHFDGENRSTAAIWNVDRPGTQLFRLEYTESVTAQNGSKRTEHQFAVCKYGNDWKLGLMNRGKNQERVRETVLEIGFTADSTDMVEVQVQQYNSEGLAIEGQFEPMILFSPQIKSLAERDSINPVILKRNFSKRAIIHCENGEFGNWTTEVKLVFDHVQAMKEVGVQVKDSIALNGELIVEMWVEYDHETGLYLPIRETEEDYTMQLQQQTIMQERTSVFGFAPVAADVLEFSGWGLYHFERVNGVATLVAHTSIREGLPLQMLRIQRYTSGDYLTHVMPMDESYRVGHIEKMGFGGPMMILMLLIFLGSLKQRGYLRLRPVLVACLFLFGFTAVQAQTPAYEVVNEDCPLPDDWKELPFMQDIGGCPTCIGEKVWLDNVRRLYCYRIAVVELKADNSDHSGKIDSLNRVIDRLRSELAPKGGFERDSVPQGTGLTFDQILQLIEAMKQDPPTVEVTIGDITNTNTNNLGALKKDSLAQDSAKVDSIPPKPKLGYVGGFFGKMDSKFSTFWGPECNCPGEIIGDNATAGATAYGVQIGMLPDYTKRFSFVPQLHLVQADIDYEYGNRAATFLPTFSRLSMAAVATPRIGPVGIELGPQFVMSHFAPVNATFATLQARAGLNLLLTDWTASVIAHSNIISGSWIDGIEAEAAHLWSIEGSLKYKNFAIFGEYGSTYSNLGSSFAEGKNLGGTTIENFVGGIRFFF